MRFAPELATLPLEELAGDPALDDPVLDELALLDLLVLDELAPEPPVLLDDIVVFG